MIGAEGVTSEVLAEGEESLAVDEQGGRLRLPPRR
jgi:hypothetical protein